MPQKKNPDLLELVRGKTGRVYGHLMALLTTMKGLPLSYNKDMQEDKEAAFDACDTVNECLRVTAIVLANIEVRREQIRSAARSGYMNATELADYLVRKGMSFRQAHETAGRIVMRAVDAGVEVEELSEADLRSFSELIEADVYGALSLEQTMATKNCVGGTSPQRVREALAVARAAL
jgi:argininosuccinate lyase